MTQSTYFPTCHTDYLFAYLLFYTLPLIFFNFTICVIRIHFLFPFFLLFPLFIISPLSFTTLTFLLIFSYLSQESFICPSFLLSFLLTLIFQLPFPLALFFPLFKFLFTNQISLIFFSFTLPSLSPFSFTFPCYSLIQFPFYFLQSTPSFLISPSILVASLLFTLTFPSNFPHLASRYNPFLYLYLFFFHLAISGSTSVPLPLLSPLFHFPPSPSST